MTAMKLEEFNCAPSGEAAATAQVWAAIPAWVDAIVAGRPYADVEQAAETARNAAAQWNTTDLEAALAHHPRIGQRPSGAGAEADASRREQASMANASNDIATAIAAANEAYEARFGRVFLIRAAGRSPQEMLAEARRRLANDDDTELAETLEQLSQIALLRLRQTLESEIES